jgi:hypothetical protein
MHIKNVRPNFRWLSAVAFCFAAAGNVAAAGPPTPTPLSPAKGASVQTPVTLSWSTVTDSNGISGYNWQVSTSSSFSPFGQETHAARRW